MNDTGAFEVVRGYCSTVMKVPAETLRPETSLRDDLDADSLDLAEINVMLEEHFGQAIGEERLGQLSTLGDIADEMCQVRP